jgi:5'-nucleotidase (lipoprotein e(P4) family)
MNASRVRLWVIPILILGLAGCAGTEPPQVADAPEAPEPTVAEEGRPWPNSILWSRTSAENRAIQLQIFRRATELVEVAAAEREPGTWAVSVDADETVIDNSIYNIELWEAGKTHSAELFFEWARRKEAPPLPGAMDFLTRVRELGGKIAVVTNRRMPICDVTEENFDKYGIPYDVMLCRPSEEEDDKTPRYEAVESGTASPDLPPLEIVLWLGDAIGDFPHLDQDLRLEGDEAYSDFGTRFLQMPNPVYGSWMGNPEE